MATAALGHREPARAQAVTATSAAGSIPGMGGARNPLPRPGTRVGQYELIRELGRGGMGAVYLARDPKLGRRVAVKLLQSNQPELTVRFILEARATARCNHENIVVIHDVGELRGNPFMVLEYLQGQPLSRLLEPGQRMPPGRAVELMVPVVRALACAHAHNIVHRDLKPDNIFVTDAGTVKVLDFGIAKLMHGDESAEGTRRVRAMAEDLAGPGGGPGDGSNGGSSAELTRHGALLGTLPYMSPEQWKGMDVDHRTDIWAVGILLYKMVAGKHPLAPERGWQLVRTTLLDEPMPLVRGDCPDLPGELAETIDRCLIKDKDRRLGSAQALLDALEPLLPGRYARRLRAHESPYPGLSAFQEADANRFFGRAREVAAAVTRLRDQPLLGVVGPSGVGKSSFVRAGVVPALKQSGDTWSALVVRPGRQPMAALAHAVAPLVARSSTHPSSSGVSSGAFGRAATGVSSEPSILDALDSDLSAQDALRARLCAEPGYLGALLRSRARRQDQRIMLFVDQFEELYTLVDDPRERLAFTACLASVADDATTPLRVVLSLRSDFLDRVAEDAYFMSELAQGLFFLAPPSREGLREAIVEPAEMAGFRFESAATIEHMLDHLEHTPGALPLLQFAASKLWDLRNTACKLLTEDSYRAVGGIAGALASHADAVVAELPPQRRPLARALFLRLITPERTRAVVPVVELAELAPDAGEVRQLVDHLVHARLLVAQSGDGEGSALAEIVHESLIQSWPRLRRWLDENQDDAAFLEQLRTAARQWQAKGHPVGLLWRGEAMEEARRWHRRYRGDLPRLQRAYLDAVFALDARAARRRRYVLAGLMVFLTFLSTAATVAMLRIRNAEQKAQANAAAAEERLEQVEAKERLRQEAEEGERAARQAEQRANAELRAANDQLAAWIDQLNDALRRAKQSKARERLARKRAEEAAAAARAAEAETERVNEKLQALLEKLEALLDRERKRVLELERRIGPIIEELAPEDLDADAAPVGAESDRAPAARGSR